MSNEDELFDLDPDTGGVRLRVEYYGPGFDGVMPARMMAEVLDALASFAEGTAHAAAGSRKAKARLDVVATETGSFDIVTELVTALPDVLKLLTTGGLGGLGFRFWWNNMRKVVERYERLPDGTYKVTMRSGEQMEWTEAQWAVHNNKRVRKAVGRLIDPLDKGATRARLQLGGETVVDVTPDTVDALRPDLEDRAVVERLDVWAMPDVVAFDPTKKWSMVTREGPVRATIEDKQFLEDVALGRVRVGGNDSFRLALRKEWVEDPEGRVTQLNTFVERVIAHQPGAEQDELPSEGRPATD